jgi:hypothetical protein
MHQLYSVTLFFQHVRIVRRVTWRAPFGMMLCKQMFLEGVQV